MSNPPNSSSSAPPDTDTRLPDFLLRTGLAQPNSELQATVLPGGVSCDVWKVDADERTFCVKRPLPRLRVAKLWEAPIERSEAEWKWLNFARSVVQDAVPRALAHDAESAMIAIEYLDPRLYPVWKQQLFDGVVDPNVAATVARIIARIHAASAGNPDVASQFRTRESFYALRIEPYLLEAARQNSVASEELDRLADETLDTEIALVHGDLSPKNILVGPNGPVILDAETASYGDPAFDVAFCLNHLLLKCVAQPKFADSYLRCFASFRANYLSGVSWEDAVAIETRAARLLPALLLARVDGKSPVEYLTERQRTFVRERAIALIQTSLTSLEDIARIWKKEIAAFTSPAERPQGD
jgi:aminoglycoside phosphotransferase (APT) family kinase protein